jgi:hypothetical protein
MDTSLENGRKLDKIIQILEGSRDVPGILSKVHQHDEMLNGNGKQLGLVTKVNVMWLSSVWVLSAISAIVGGWIVHALKL